MYLNFGECLCLCFKNIVENMNLDICVVDGYNNVIIVVNCVGEFRFWYMGIFNFIGIVIDS